VNLHEKILLEVDGLPSLPQVVIKLQELLRDPDVEFRRLARIIEMDPGLTANILQLANSALLGWSGEVSSLQSAVVRLGTKRIYEMILCLSVADLVRRPIRGYGMAGDVLWLHSIAVATCADELAKLLRLKSVADAFTAGLLHDIGKIALGTFLQIDDGPLKSAVADADMSFDEAEARELGLDHAEAGGLILEKWHLPEHVVRSTRWHHRPFKAGSDPLTDLVHVSDILCTSVGWGLGADGLHYRLEQGAVERLGMGGDIGDKLMCRVLDKLKEMESLLAAGSGKGGQRVPEHSRG